VLREILKGGVDKVRESGASLLGGHSVEDEEIKYGLSVSGIVDPRKIVRNEGARPGDHLVLTKPLGTGILISAMKGNLVSREAEGALTESMATLNRAASAAMLRAGAHAATDVTGFGLAGHLKEMIKENIGVTILADNLPYFPEAEGLAAKGFLPAGFYNNRDFYGPCVESEVSGFLFDLLFDPQSSGGLLIALDDAGVERFASAAAENHLDYRPIGRFTEGPKGKILVT
jgi:selenide,water dikinase